MPLISIIIPTYKHQDYVYETLASVFNQTFADYEVIIVNDGSPDNTREVLQPLADAGKIKYIEQENQGQASARNRGLAEARGSFVAFLDDDDLWPPEKLGWQVKYLQANPQVEVIAGQIQTIDSQGEVTQVEFAQPGFVSFETLFYGCPIWSPGQTLIRKAALDEVGGFSTQIWGADDYDLWMRLGKRSPLSIDSRLALYYRKHATNASHNSPRMLVNSHQVIQLHVRHLDPKKRSAYRRAVYRWLYSYLGKLTLDEAIRVWQSRGLLHAWSTLRSLKLFFLPMLKDPKLAISIGRDLKSRWKNRTVQKSKTM